MADFTLDEIRAMQADAIRRVREMNERAKLSVENSNSQYREAQNRNTESYQAPPVHNKSSTPPPPKNNRQGYNRLGNQNEQYHKQPTRTSNPPSKQSVSKRFFEPPPPPPKKTDHSLFGLGSGFLQNFDFKNILKSFNINNILNNPEQAFILMLLLLLLSEGADEILIFALIYIML
ncbi:MAG: hypothetical protein BGN88_02430 [Clostridiales bacterium 43-6]|nr:MAG: hypothetical protein BGN88_02430 [Clostridiales bacterium 43-6]